MVYNNFMKKYLVTIFLVLFGLVAMTQGALESLGAIGLDPSLDYTGETDTSVLNFQPPGLLTSSPNPCANIADFKGLVNCLTTAILTPLVSLLLGIALVYFLWGVIQYIRKLGGTEREEAKQRIWYGLLALFVMVSVWGLVWLLVNSFGLDNNALPTPHF